MLFLRGVFYGACCLIILAAVQAPARAAPAEQPVRFRAQNLPAPHQTDVTAIARRAVLGAFLERHPEYEIEPFVMPAVRGTAMDSGPLMAIAAGHPPHAIYVNFRQSSTYISQGFIEPLEILLARVLSDNDRVRQTDDRGRWLADPTPAEVADALEQIRQRVAEPAWPVVYREDEDDPAAEKHVWAIPTNHLVKGLLYRKDLFHRAGLDPERPPQDWDELLEYARRLTIPERRQFGIMFSAGPHMSYSMYNFLVGSGARAVERDEQGEWRGVYDSREAAEAVAYFWELINGPFERDGQIIRGAAAFGAADMQLMWTRGQIGMQFAYLDDEMIATVNPQLVGIAPVPSSPGGTSGAELNCMMLGVFSESAPEQKLAVMRYIWFITGEEAQRIRTRVYVENGFGQFVSPDLLRKFGYERLLRQVPAGWQEAFQTAMSHGVPEPYGRNTQSIYRYMSTPIYSALELPLDRMPREAALEEIQSLLRASVQEFNIKVLGHIPPEQMRVRRIVAVAAILVIGVIFAVGILHVWRYFTTVARPFHERRSWRRFAWGYVLLAPALLLVVMWQYIPLAGGLSIAFTDYQLVRESIIVGVDNFANVLFDDKFWNALGRTFYFVALMIGLGFWPPILLAILLQEVPTNGAKYLYRTIFYLPAVVSGVVVMFLWRQLYDPSEQGVLNQIMLSLNRLDPFSATLIKWVALGLWLSLVGLLLWIPIKMEELSRPIKGSLFAAGGALALMTVWPLISAFRGDGGGMELAAAGVATAGSGGIGAVVSTLGNLVGSFNLEPLRWIHSPDMAMLCVVIPTVWATAGPGCILYLAALKSVPDELYEAADIDGASNLHKVVYIVLPRLKYLIVIQFIAAVIGAFRGGADYILALTGGGPNEATTILSLEIFIRTFFDLRFGIGTAMAWILGAVLIGFTAYQLKMLSRAEFRAAGGGGK